MFSSYCTMALGTLRYLSHSQKVPVAQIDFFLSRTMQFGLQQRRVQSYNLLLPIRLYNIEIFKIVT